ncbi:MAG TPA: molybdopterin-dependent oxidoreductase, partial [Nitrospiria bacterium]|nr:molybdopterin-dependent oxidoreductase [Nitrospiria bacterium]
YVGKTRAGRFKRFYIQYIKFFRRVRAEEWRLKITGMVENPQSLTLEEVQGFPRKIQNSRLKCVECWSARAEWEGFHFSELEERVRPRPEAVGVVFRCADTYEEFLSLEDLNHERTMLVHRMNGEPLSDEHGFPLRVIIPFKYGYKSPKAILEMEFVDKVIPGTWSRIGPYSVDGTILPGHDTPLDGDGERRRIPGGEVFD